MPDTPKTPETAPDTTPDTTPDATLATPTVAADVSASRPELSVADAARLLGEHFPALFGEGVIKPIKLRIQADIHERAPGVFTKKALSIFLQRHTTRTVYLRALVAEGATRFDLDGQPAGEIAAEHREAAGVELARRRAIVDARKHAGREAARASGPDARPKRPAPPLRSPHQAEGIPAASQATDERQATRRGRPAQPGAADRQNRADRQARPDRPDRQDRPDRSPRPAQPGRGPRPPHKKPLPERHTDARAHEPAPVNAPAVSLTPEQAAEAQARQRRAVLLRSFEQSPLSKANFGALKGLSEAALDALLAQARQERGPRG